MNRNRPNSPKIQTRTFKMETTSIQRRGMKDTKKKKMKATISKIKKIHCMGL